MNHRNLFTVVGGLRRGTLVVTAALVVFASAAIAPELAAEEVLDGIAAQVGGDVVLISEVRQLAAPIEARMRAAGMPASEVATMRADILDRLIEGRLIAEVVRRLELSASEEEVNRAVEGIARDTGLTLEQLEQSVGSHGLTRDEYRAKIRDEIERSKVLNNMVRQRVRVEPSEIEVLYQQQFGSQPDGGEEVRVRHLLVAFGPQFNRDRSTACRMVEDAKEIIQEGKETFEQTARELSDANPQRGGDLGWIHTQELAGWMGPVVEELKEGEISGVVETRFGCNLLTLEGRRTFTQLSFEEAKPKLENAIFRQKMEVEYSKWVDTLREQTYIERKGSFSSSASPKPPFGGDGDGTSGPAGG